MIELYELAATDDKQVFSPYCWRIRLALHHKGLPFKSIPWRMTEKDRIAFADTERVPVLVDGEQKLDLNYQEDSAAETDANFVMDDKGELIEIQCSA
ncbi:MAG: glutathione S-transferase N-terminal domain-containing protein, partial [SAR324 cluster bacterium]|nr:glutathione S-transferase N-terminal domain-containing protein [SAR324 cluster bacterium]